MTQRERLLVFGLLGLLTVIVGATAAFVVRDHYAAPRIIEDKIREANRGQSDRLFEAHVNRLDDNLGSVRQSLGEIANRVDSLESKMLKLESAGESRKSSADEGNANK